MNLRFGDFAIDAGRRELSRGGQAIHVEPQVFDLLLYLVQNRDRVVSKDDLLAAVWNGRIVSESTLSNRINAARQAIGDNGEEQRLIRTVPRRGFRFVGEVNGDPQEEAGTFPQKDNVSQKNNVPRQEGEAPALPLPDKPSIAVLPFANMSDDAQQEYFADGMAEEIITALSRCGWLFVIARNSSFTYKDRNVDVRQVGRELGVRYVLEGSVRRAADRVRFSAQLIDSANGAHLWADRFEGDLGDVFALQDRITESVVAVIEPRLQRAEIERLKQKPAANLDAYDLYLRALQLEYEFTEDSLNEAIRCLERAVVLDPAYAPAFALAAYCYAERAFQAWIKDFASESAAALRLSNRAIELAPQDGNVLWMSAYPIWWFSGDAPRARELFNRSLALNSNSPIALTMSAWIEMPTGETGLARERLERAARLSPRDPRDWMTSMSTAMCNMWEHRFEESVAWADRVIGQNPRALPALRTKLVGLVHLGKLKEARELAREILRIDPKFSVSVWRNQRAPIFRAENPRFDFILNAYRAAGVPE